MDSQLLPMLTEGALIVISLIASAFFSGSEVALTSISAAQISRIAGKDFDQHPLADWLKNPSKYLTTLLVGTNVANILAALLAGDLMRRLVWVVGGEELSEGALPGSLAFVSMTFLVLVFGEIIPKIICRHHHETLAPRFVRWLRNVYRILKYPIKFLMAISNFLIRTFGGEPAKDVSFVTADDLKLLIEVGEKQGLLEEGEREMLHSIFELSETPVKEVMTPRVDMIFVGSEDELNAVLETFEEHDFSRLPVIEGNRDNVVGILYMKDLLHRWRNEKTNGSIVQELMRPPLFVPESKRIDDVLEQFQKEKTHIAIVVDEYGGTEGLVTIEDILEEIVGEIEDEFDEEKTPIEQVSEDTWTVDAAVDAEELVNEIGLELPEEVEYESLAGFLLETHGDLPKPGEVVEFQGYRFTIIEADERRITKVQVEKLSESTDEPAPQAEGV